MKGPEIKKSVQEMLDEAYNLAIDHCVKILHQNQTNVLENKWLIDKLLELKK